MVGGAWRRRKQFFGRAEGDGMAENNPVAGSIELIQVSKRFGASVAVDQINLNVPRASYCCLLGPSGCGKTTTLRLIAGHETASDGDVLISGNNVTTAAPAQRGTAMMFQNYALFPHLNCLENVAFSLRMHGVDTSDLRTLSLHAMDDPCILTNPRESSLQDVEVVYAEAL